MCSPCPAPLGVVEKNKPLSGEHPALEAMTRFPTDLFESSRWGRDYGDQRVIKQDTNWHPCASVVPVRHTQYRRVSSAPIDEALASCAVEAVTTVAVDRILRSNSAASVGLRPATAARRTAQLPMQPLHSYTTSATCLPPAGGALAARRTRSAHRHRQFQSSIAMDLATDAQSSAPHSLINAPHFDDVLKKHSYAASFGSTPREPGKEPCGAQIQIPHITS